MRSDGRESNELRTVEIIPHYTKWAEGSVLVQFGDTQVLCTVTIDDRLPRWLHKSDDSHGWVSAEYGMLPRSCDKRAVRERQFLRGRTQEIERLIGRSLRMGVDLRRLGMRQLLVDCDVIQADGGTRTAAITGSWVAMQLALWPLIEDGKMSKKVFKHQVAAVSVGMVNGVPLLDLAYDEDSAADADINVVMTGTGEFIEVQGTGENAPFDRKQLSNLLDLAEHGCNQLLAIQSDLIDNLQF